MADLLKSKRLREERAPLVKQIQDLGDKMAVDLSEGRGETAEDTEKYKTINAQFDNLTRAIQLAERNEHISITDDADDETRDAVGKKDATIPGRQDVRHDATEKDDDEHRNTDPTEEDRAMVLQGWMLAQLDKPVQQRHKVAAQKCGVNLHSRHFDVSFRRDYHQFRKEHRAQSTQVLAGGGATVAEGFMNNLEVALLDFGGMRAVADVMRTEKGGNIPWPTTNDTSNEGSLLGENTSVGTAVDVAFGQVVFHDYKYSSGLVQCPVELIEDSAFNLSSTLGGMLGERLARITNRHFTVADGNSRPHGLMARAAVGVTAASASAITFDEIMGLIHSVDPAYRNSAGFMMHDTTLLAIRKLKGGDGQYLWQPSNQVGQPDRLLGYGITPNQHCAVIAESALVIAFGAFNKYKIRDVAGFRLRRLVERYADTDQEGFIAFSRHDGNLLDAGTNPVKTLQMHA